MKVILTNRSRRELTQRSMKSSLLSAANNDLASPSFGRGELTNPCVRLGLMRFTGKYTPSYQFLTRSRFWAVFLVIVVVFAGRPLPGQSLDMSRNEDTTLILLADLGVQLECTQALNDLYNFR